MTSLSVFRAGVDNDGLKFLELHPSEYTHSYLFFCFFAPDVRSDPSETLSDVTDFSYSGRVNLFVQPYSSGY